MTQRWHIGNRNGAQGFFLSRPGDDVMDNEKSLLVDSRYPTMAIHHKGRFSLNNFYPGAGSHSVFYGDDTFPSLGYEPLFLFSVMYMSSNNAGIPPRAAYYPCSWGLSDITDDSYILLPNNDLMFSESGCWLVDNSTIAAKCWLRVNLDIDVRVNYIILKNRLTP